MSGPALTPGLSVSEAAELPCKSAILAASASTFPFPPSEYRPTLANALPRTSSATMVLLTMTPAMANGLKRLKTSTAPATGSDSEASTSEVSVTEGEADLSAPDVAKPISHEHVLQLWKDLKALPDTESQNSAPTLEALLIGASVYVPPPPPKPEPVRSPYPHLLPCTRESTHRWL